MMRSLFLIAGVLTGLVSAWLAGTRSAETSTVPPNFVERLQNAAADIAAPPPELSEGLRHVDHAFHEAVAAASTPPDPSHTLDRAAAAARSYEFRLAASLAAAAIGAGVDGELHQRALRIHGFSSLRDGDAPAARDSLSQLSPDGELFGYEQFWLAQACLLAGDFQCANDAARQARHAIPRDMASIEAAVIEQRAALHVEEHPEEAVIVLQELLATYPEYPHRQVVRVEIAEAWHRVGEHARAAALLDTLLWDKPWSPLVPRVVVLRSRVEHPTPQRSFAARLERAERMRAWRQWTLADAELQELLQIAGSDRDRSEVLHELVLNSYEDARFEDVLRWSDDLERLGAVGISVYERQRWRARALGRLGRRDEAYQVMRASLGEPLVTADHEVLGEFAFDLGLWTRSIEHRRVTWSRSQWNDFDGAFLLYMAAELSQAESVFRSQYVRNFGSTRARFGYWLARTLMRQNQPDEARRIWAEIAEERPFEYYGVQSRNRLLDTGEGALAQPGRIAYAGHGHSPDGAWSLLPASVRTDLFTEYPGAVSDGALASFAESWGALFPAAQTAAALHAIGALEESRRVFRDVVFEFRGLNSSFADGRVPTAARPITFNRRLWYHEVDNRRTELGLWGSTDETRRFPAPSGTAANAALAERQLAIRTDRTRIATDLVAAIRDAGDPYFTRQDALGAGLADLVGATESDILRWRDAFPHAWARRMRDVIARTDLNPYLFWALILVESAFNPDTVSIADAYGLTQVIPKTGELVVERMGLGDVGVHALLEPDAAIQFGSYYLAELVHKFHGQEMLACVAYNAGAHAVARWLDWRGHAMAMDEFIESVPFTQSRRYAQRIVQHMSTYRWVYQGTPDLYIGNVLDPVHEPNINF